MALRSWFTLWLTLNDLRTVLSSISHLVFPLTHTAAISNSNGREDWNMHNIENGVEKWHPRHDLTLTVPVTAIDALWHFEAG